MTEARPVQWLTLSYLRRPGELCLGYKKRGFGADLYNGFGGKCSTGESITAAAVRELREECGVTVPPAALQPVADITFVYTEKIHRVPTFLVTTFTGTPVETDEMKPTWFPESAVPYYQMWADDVFWLPAVLHGVCLTGTVHFAADDQTVTHHSWQIVEPAMLQARLATEWPTG